MKPIVALPKLGEIVRTVCDCGSASFTSPLGYDSPSPAQFTADQMLDYAEQARADLLADAARYRWFKEQCRSITNLVQYRAGNVTCCYPCNSAADMDAAIDAAMRGETTKGQA